MKSLIVPSLANKKDSIKKKNDVILKKDVGRRRGRGEKKVDSGIVAYGVVLPYISASESAQKADVSAYDSHSGGLSQLPSS